jgi:anaerobic ribonucleoside-triphosphate reductase activating protein
MNDSVRIAGIIDESIVDGPGIRFVVFTQGCRHKCKGCHNPHTHDYEGGESVSIESILDKINKNPLLDGVTLSGGEPFDQADSCAIIAKEAGNSGLNVITYTGYLFEQLYIKALNDKGVKDLLESTDILVDGPFVLSKRNLMLHFRGSENQRIIDLKRTMSIYPETKEIIIKEL